MPTANMITSPSLLNRHGAVWAPLSDCRNLLLSSSLLLPPTEGVGVAGHVGVGVGMEETELSTALLTHHPRGFATSQHDMATFSIRALPIVIIFSHHPELDLLLIDIRIYHSFHILVTEMTAKQNSHQYIET